MSQPSRSPGASVLLAGSGVDDLVGCQALDRPDGLAVVAVLGVVVVLEDQPVPALRPGHERGTPLRGQDGPGREVVGGREDDGVGIGPGEGLDDDPLVIDRDRNDLEPRCAGRPDGVALARVLHRDPTAAHGPDDLRDQPKRLGEAVADDDPFGVGGRAADPVQVRRERLAQLPGSPVVEVAQAIARRLREDPAQGAEPDLARELRHVGPSVDEVDPWRRRGTRNDRHAGRLGHPRADSRRAARPAGQVALGDELFVRLHDDAPRHAELLGQQAR